MRLSILYEADFSRRGFLRAMLGAAVPFVPGVNLLKFISGMPGPSARYVNYLKSYKNSKISDDVIGNIVFKLYSSDKLESNLFKLVSSKENKDTGAMVHSTVEIPKDVVKGFMIDNVNTENDLTALIGDEIGQANRLLDGLIGELFEGMVKKLGPKTILKQFVDKISPSNDVMQAAIGDTIHLSNTFKKFMNQFGIDSQVWEALYRGKVRSIDFFEKLDLISPKTAMHNREIMKTNEGHITKYDKEYEKRMREQEQLEQYRLRRKKQRQANHIMHKLKPIDYNPNDF